MSSPGLSLYRKILYHAECTEYAIKSMNEEGQLELKTRQDQGNKREDNESLCA